MASKGCSEFTSIRQATGLALGEAVLPFLARMEGRPTVVHNLKRRQPAKNA